MHVTKYTRGTLGHMLGHYDRTKDGLGENVVPERTQLNYNLAVDDQPLKQLDFVHKRLGEVRCLKRKDVNVLCDWVVTMPKDLVDEYREPFFKAAYNFFAEKYGHDNVVSAYVHMDEMQPHMHFAFVPVVADRKRDGWKLSAKEAITRVDLQHIHEQMQTQLTQELGVPVNLLNEATIEGNRSIKELKRGTAVEAVNKLKSEQMEIAQDIITESKDDESYDLFFVLDCGSEDRGFESHYPPHKKCTPQGCIFYGVKWDSKRATRPEGG